jgi:hypothetical protein
MRKHIAFFVIITAIITPLWAQTEADFRVAFTADRTGVVITRYEGSATQVRIPATIEGIPVREIGQQAFEFKQNDITSVVIPDGITIIRSRAFYWCSKLTSVTLPNTLIRIEENAFRLCGVLTAIKFPDTLTYIGEQAFMESGLTSVTWPMGIPVISKDAFSRCIKLQSVIIPEGITAIDEMAFGGCSALTSISLPSTIDRLTAAFASCTSLTTVNIPNTVTSISFDPAPYTGQTKTFFNCSSMSLVSQVALKRLGYTGDFGGAFR